MSCNFDDKVIDLTSSFTNSATNSRIFTNVINLDSDESIVDLNSSAEQNNEKAVSKVKQGKKKPMTTHKENDTKVHYVDQQSSQSSRKLSSSGKKHKFGQCPICWDELGKNRLASTKCGHVFCLKCLEQSFKVVKRCPTCRKVLKNSHYHPLYLSTD